MKDQDGRDLIHHTVSLGVINKENIETLIKSLDSNNDDWVLDSIESLENSLEKLQRNLKVIKEKIEETK